MSALDQSDETLSPVAGSCEHSNESSVSIKAEQLLTR
jgi:hypothetical protein